MKRCVRMWLCVSFQSDELFILDACMGHTCSGGWRDVTAPTVQFRVQITGTHLKPHTGRDITRGPVLRAFLVKALGVGGGKAVYLTV